LAELVLVLQLGKEDQVLAEELAHAGAQRMVHQPKLVFVPQLHESRNPHYAHSERARERASERERERERERD
jgi:hypothetical protein